MKSVTNENEKEDNMNVLVVDDSVIFTRQLKKYLSDKGLSVDVANGGRSALEMMGNGKYDVVVLDLKMPDLPGVEVLRWARQHGVSSRFVIVTGYGDIDTAVETMKLGADEYIQKPFRAEELMEIIKEAGSRVSSRYGIRAENPKDWMKQMCESRHTLLITDKNPKNFERNYGIKATRSVHLNDHLRTDTLGRTKFSMLTDVIEKFAKIHEDAIVIHGGISRLLDIYGADELQEYFMGIYGMAKEGHFHMIVVYESPVEKELFRVMQEIPFFLSIEEMSKVLGSVIRCLIIRVLDERKILRYSDLMKETNVGLSSDLAFHLKKLMDWEIISKEGEHYSLSPRGQYFAGILGMLLSGGYRDPASNIMYCEL